MKRKLIILALLVLLIPFTSVEAYSSANYNNHRFVVVGGDSASSSSFSGTIVIGQPATGVGTSSNYKVTVGFLHPVGRNHTFITWLPVLLK